MLFIVAWSTLYLNVHLDVDTSWLLQCLNRFLAGGSYTKDFYETNPPLSFLIYLPAYPLYTYLGVGAKLSVFLTLLTYISFANVLTVILLRKFAFKTMDVIVIMTGFIMAQSWASGVSFGSKDHLIMIFMVPSCLYQYRLTQGHRSGWVISAASIFMGGIAICLKPYYSIIPFIFFAHRLYTTRSVSRCIFAPDFLGMLAIGASYLAFTWFITPEFFTLIPEISSLYSVERPFPLYFRYYYLVYAAVAAASARFVFTDPDEQNLKKAIYAFSALSFICLIPYLLQDKGFHYHALPLLGFGAAAIFITIFSIAKEISKKQDIALWIGCIAMFGLFGGYTTGNKFPKLTKNQFLAMPLVDTIDDLAWNRVYATYDFKNLLTPLPIISPLESGSRFGQLWPMNALTEQVGLTNDKEKRKEIKKRMFGYVDIIVEDIKRFKPSVVTVPQYIDPDIDAPAKRYYEMLISHDGFKKIMENYTYEKTVDLDTNLNLKKQRDTSKIVPHDVFVLKRDHNL